MSLRFKIGETRIKHAIGNVNTSILTELPASCSYLNALLLV